MPTVRLAQPPGCRSTRGKDGTLGLGGAWQECEDQFGGMFSAQYAHLAERLAESDAKLLKAEIAGKMSKATHGKLFYGETARDGDVTKANCVSTVLELRLDDHNMSTEDGEEEQRHIRLYFSEPEHLDGLLLLVSLRHKLPGPLGVTAQTGHMKDADAMIHRHFVLKGMR